MLSMKNIPALLMVLVGVFVFAASAGARSPEHHANTGRFVNPYVAPSSGGVFSFLRRRVFGADHWASYDSERDGVVPTAEPRLVAVGEQSNNARVTWIGQSTVLIQHEGVNVITDPIFSALASPFGFVGPARKSAPGMTLEALPPIDIVVISHDHYDHLDAPTIRRLGNRPRYFVPLGLKAWMVAAGIAEHRVVELDWWESRSVASRGAEVSITATPSQHVSGRTLTDRNRRLWSAWAIGWDDFSVWFGGDTGYNDVQFKAIGDRFEGFDLGIIPIGGYGPRTYMGDFHVDPAQAVQIHQDIGARRSMAVHWGTFHLTAEPLLEPPRALRAAVQSAGLPTDSVTAFAVGESRSYLPR
jgi:N-acyl-phosphatidylethanolamine-hydrolysing phospholipase D